MEGIFWKDGFEGECRGGLYFRAFDMMKFVDRIQSEGQEIVAIKFDDSNNLEFIVGKMKEEPELSLQEQSDKITQQELEKDLFEGNWCNPNPDGEGLAGNEKVDE